MFFQVELQDSMTQRQGSDRNLPAGESRSFPPKHQQQGFQINKDKMKQPTTRYGSN